MPRLGRRSVTAHYQPDAAWLQAHRFSTTDPSIIAETDIVYLAPYVSGVTA